MKIDKKFILDFIRLIKPEFYNKITWTLVVAGIAMFSAPIWQDILVAFLNKKLDLNITPVSETGWGLYLIIVGLFYNFVTNSFLQCILFLTDRDKVENIKSHDITIFKNSEHKLSEVQFKSFTNELLCGHAFWYEQSNRVDDFIHFFKHVSNNYMQETLVEKEKLLNNDLNKLMEFLTRNFEIYPRNQTENYRFHLYPIGNIDYSLSVSPEHDKKYDDLRDELHRLVSSAEEKYLSYRSVVKSKLYL
jgi:hypothetical protein